VPSFLPHAVAPALVAAAFFPVPRRTLLLYLPLVWAPDLDYLVQSQHRAVTHSILIPLVLLAVVAFLWRRRDRTARFWEFATRPGAPVGLSLSAFYVASHAFMDIFAGGVVLLWPVTYTTFFMDFQIILDTGSNTFEPTGSTGSHEGTPPLSPTFPWVSYVDTAVAAFLGACGSVWLAVRQWRKARGTLPREPVVLRRAATLATPIHKH
jgi:hypothetical protein